MKANYSVDLTRMLELLTKDKSASRVAIRELSPEERDIYLEELTKHSIKNRDKLMKMINKEIIKGSVKN